MDFRAFPRYVDVFAHIVLFGVAAIWLLVILWGVFLWYCDDRARDWREWRSEVARHIDRDGLNRFLPTPPWYVRVSERYIGCNRLGRS